MSANYRGYYIAYDGHNVYWLVKDNQYITAVPSMKEAHELIDFILDGK